MKLAFGFLGYLGALAAIVVAAFIGFRIITPTESGAAFTTASASSSPAATPRPREPKRLEPIRPINEPARSPDQRYELSGVPLSATAAYNKKKAQEQYGKHHSAHRSTPRPLSPEAASAFGSADASAAQPRYQPRDWSIY